MPKAPRSSQLTSPETAVEPQPLPPAQGVAEPTQAQGPEPESAPRHPQASAKLPSERYQRCFEASPDGILLVDPLSQQVLDCNPALERLSGEARGQLLEQPLRQLGFLVEAISWLEELMAAPPLAPAARIWHRLRLRHRNGQWRPGFASAHAFVADGSPILQISFCQIGRAHV